MRIAVLNTLCTYIVSKTRGKFLLIPREQYVSTFVQEEKVTGAICKTDTSANGHLFKACIFPSQECYEQSSRGREGPTRRDHFAATNSEYLQIKGH